MPTIDDNIRSMASLVASVKKEHHLTENTVMRIIDMNFALAQQAKMPSFSGDEDLPFEGAEDAEDIGLTPQQLSMFPDIMPTPDTSGFEDNTNGLDDDEVLATTDHPLEN